MIIRSNSLHIPLRDKSVHCVITSPRDDRGRFKLGTHYREPKPFWQKEWLENEYLLKKKSAGEIAEEFSVGETAILFWLNKHGIKTRSVSETRKFKKWGSPGEKNPMFGKCGELNPNWKGGTSPYRQKVYSRSQWKSFRRKIVKRDRVCRLCGEAKNTDVHHIEAFSCTPLIPMDASSTILLCVDCHKKIRGKEKWWRKRLYRILQEGA